MSAKQLRLRAKIVHRTPRHSTIAVWQNGGKAGELVVDAAVAGEVIRRLIAGNKKVDESWSLPETSGTLHRVWINDENNRRVCFEIDYTIDSYEAADHFTLTPQCGGGVEITDIRVDSVFLVESDDPTVPWLAVIGGRFGTLPDSAAAHLVARFEHSKAYETLEDACRKHAGREV